ncbi:MAG: hypothetical protein N2593_00535 [Patescibacteria group bacterium]|nr:hypothetical protein [Patescibacteria group bacterium]
MLKLIKSNKINFLSLLLILISFLNLFFIIKNNFYKYTEKFDPKKYELKYNNSQYVIPKSKNPISDAELYAYAGYRYIKGQNPLYLNAEHLTLGKYLIGFSILIFNNQNVINLIFVFLIFILFFKIIYLITKSFFLSSLGIFILSFDSFIYDMIINPPLLDIYQLFFLLAIFYFLLKWKTNQKNKYVILIGICLGLFASVKFYLVSIVLLGTLIINFFILKKYFLKNILIIIFFSLLAFNLTYIQSFLLKTNLNEFIKSQKWIFNFWRFNDLNNIQAKGNFLKLIIFNQWKIWWSDKKYINYQYWNLAWPIFFILGLSIVFYHLKNFFFFKKKLSIKDFSLNLFSTWIIFYILYLFLIPIYPRYLILLYPIIYLNILIFCDKILKQYV